MQNYEGQQKIESNERKKTTTTNKNELKRETEDREKMTDFTEK